MEVMTTKLNSDDAEAWDVYAAAALSASVEQASSPQQAVAVAVELADLLLEQRQIRRKAYSDFINS